jgi:hypothetical protein
MKVNSVSKKLRFYRILKWVIFGIITVTILLIANAYVNEDAFEASEFIQWFKQATFLLKLLVSTLYAALLVLFFCMIETVAEYVATVITKKFVKVKPY